MINTTDIHVMVDLETLSNDTRNGVVLALGAVAFQIQTPILEPLPGEYEFSTSGNRFFLPIEIAGQRKYGLTTEPETVNWWFGSDDRCRIIATYLASIYARPINDVFEMFENWVMAEAALVEPTQEKKIYMWSHGVTYDCVHLAEKWPKIMGASFNTVCPFRQMRDTRTLYAVYEMKYGWKPYPQWAKKDHPMKHHPLYDAYVQAVAVQIAINGLLAPTSN